MESFERARDDQKRLKKKNWSRQNRVDEFDELFEGGGQKLLNADIQLCLLNERVFSKANSGELSDTNSNTNPGETSNATTPIVSSANSSPRKRSRSGVKILDFDALESLLLSLQTRLHSARAILDAASALLRSDALFFTDFAAVKDGLDQPSVSYYRNDDDQVELPGSAADSHFQNDDLGRFARGCSYTDDSKKFYCQRAHRFRFLADQDLTYFFPSSLKRKSLRDDLFYLKRTVRDFEDFLSELFGTETDDLILLVEQQKLLPAVALLAVIFLISPEELNDYRPISRLRCLRSCRKFGLAWTVQSILEQKRVRGEECVLVSIRGHENGQIGRGCRDFRIQQKMTMKKNML